MSCVPFAHIQRFITFLLQVCGRVFEDLMAVRKHMQMEHSDEDFEFTKVY